MNFVTAMATFATTAAYSVKSRDLGPPVIVRAMGDHAELPARLHHDLVDAAAIGDQRVTAGHLVEIGGTDSAPHHLLVVFVAVAVHEP
jgi:hypothetical protein